MKFLFKLLLLLLFISPLLLIGGVLYSLSDTPELNMHARELTQQDIQRAKTILSENNPKKLADGAVRDLMLTDNDLNITANYLLQQISNGNAEVKLGNDSLHMLLTAELPNNPAGRYLNLELRLKANRQVVEINQLRLGRLQIPAWLAQAILDGGHWFVASNEHWLLFQSTLDHFNISPQQVSIRYRWRSQWEQVARQQLDQHIDQAATLFYASQLAGMPVKDSADPAQVLARLFSQAAERTGAGRNPQDENKALLFVLGNWALGRSAATNSPALPAFHLKLRKRGDLAQHYLVSAAIAANSDSLLSNMIGLSKEISDSDRGSGFSFADLTADRAGTMLGSMATANNNAAKTVQQQLASVVDSQQLLPPISHLPAPMTAQQFRKKYGGTQDPRYRQLLEQIDSSIKSLALYSNTL